MINIETHRQLLMKASSVATQIAAHQEYYDEAKKNPNMDKRFLEGYHKNRMKKMTSEYAQALTELFKMNCEAIGFEIKPVVNGKDVVSLSENYSR